SAATGAANRSHTSYGTHTTYFLLGDYLPTGLGSFQEGLMRRIFWRTASFSRPSLAVASFPLSLNIFFLRLRRRRSSILRSTIAGQPLGLKNMIQLSNPWARADCRLSLRERALAKGDNDAESTDAHSMRSLPCLNGCFW